MFGFIKKVFGIKSKLEKDLETYQPLVDQVNTFYEAMHPLSIDELRAKTGEFRDRINDYLSEIDKEIEKVRDEAVETEDLLQKELIASAGSASSAEQLILAK